MAQYSIEQSEVDDVDITRDEPIEIGYTNESIAAYYKLRLAHVIADNFKVIVFTTNGEYHSARTISFYGYRSDVQTAIELFTFVLNVMEWNWWHRYYGKVRGNKKDYSMGFVNGLAARFREQVAKNGWGLILVTPAAVVEACNKDYKIVKTVSTAKTRRSDAYLFGMDDGHKFDHKKKVLTEGN